MSSTFDLRLLKHFTVVYRLGSFSQAASEVGLSQSALTKRVQQLESDLGVALFHRTTRSVTPTEAGRRLYRRALDLLAQAETVRQGVLGDDSELKIIAGPQMLETLVIPALKRFRVQRREVRLTILSMPPTLAMDELLQRRAHLILFHDQVIRALPHQDRLEITEVIDEPYVIVCRPGHPVLNMPRSIEASLAHEWVLIGQRRMGIDLVMQSQIRRDVLSQMGKSGFPKYIVPSISAALDLVRTEGLLTAVPRMAVAGSLASGDLMGFEANTFEGLFARYSVAVLKESRMEPVITDVIDLLRQTSSSIGQFS